jgi:hypothetical protein
LLAVHSSATPGATVGVALDSGGDDAVAGADWVGGTVGDSVCGGSSLGVDDEGGSVTPGDTELGGVLEAPIDGVNVSRIVAGGDEGSAEPQAASVTMASRATTAGSVPNRAGLGMAQAYRELRLVAGGRWLDCGHAR